MQYVIITFFAPYYISLAHIHTSSPVDRAVAEKFVVTTINMLWEGMSRLATTPKHLALIC